MGVHDDSIKAIFPQHALAPGLINFGQLLEQRLLRGVFTTEDDVRYTLFFAFGIGPADIILEYPHPNIERARIDTWIPSFRGSTFAIEFKYDRPIPSAGNQPRTQKAGHLLKDLFRLAQLHSHSTVDALFVYLTSREMAEYLSRTNNGLTKLFNAKDGNVLRIDEDYVTLRSKTFRNAAGPVTPCMIKVLLTRSLPTDHELRVFRVSAADEDKEGHAPCASASPGPARSAASSPATSSSTASTRSRCWRAARPSTRSRKTASSSRAAASG